MLGQEGRLLVLAIVVLGCWISEAGAAQFQDIGRIINIPGTVGAGWGAVGSACAR